MKVLGIKTTHDASVALIEDGHLRFCIEAEKLGRERYAKFNGIDDAMQAADVDCLDSIVIDGWKTGEFAAYHEFQSIPPEATGQRKVKGGFASFHHVYGHVAGSYMLSPYAGKESAYVLVWDGGVQPRLYLWEKGVGARFITSLHEIYGVIYGIKGYYWGPFKDASKVVIGGEAPDPSLQFYGGYSMPGKLMGWIGLGKANPQYFPGLEACYEKALRACGRRRKLAYNQTGILEHLLCHYAKELMASESDEDAMATFHAWLTHFTIERAKPYVRGLPLINAGGCALNIKLNSALRDQFNEVWVPPVPNDSGSGIGVACAEWFFLTRQEKIEWSVFCGPSLICDEMPEGWVATEGDQNTVARLIADGEVVCFLDGKAEIGPRALGNRSLLADPRRSSSKVKLNDFKRREDWRPVSPIALADDCKSLFKCSTKELDRFMIFDHAMPGGAQASLPAVAHVDKTARLQTAITGSTVVDTLKAFKKITGYGVLCNTSANLPGKGFFHRASDACNWSDENGVKVVWADGKLLQRQGSPSGC